MEQKVGQVAGQIQQAAQDNRNTETKSKFIPQKARFKLQFIYRNGRTSPPYHSYDTQGRSYDERTGLVKLIRLVEKERQKDTFVVATIFANTNAQPYTYFQGKPNKAYNAIIYKEVRGAKGQYADISFTEGVLDTAHL